MGPGAPGGDDRSGRLAAGRVITAGQRSLPRARRYDDLRKTRSVFDGYNIVSERDLHEAGHKLNEYIRERDSQLGSDKRLQCPKKRLNARKPIHP